MHWDPETPKEWTELGNQHPTSMLSFHFRTSGKLYSFSFLLLYTIWMKMLLTWAEIKTGYSIKSWSCHLYCTDKGNSNHFSGRHRAFSHIGSQSTLQLVMHFAQAFEWGKEQSWVILSATKCWWSADSALTPQWERALSFNIRKWLKGSLDIIALLCSVLALSDEELCFPGILPNLIGTMLSAIFHYLIIPKTLVSSSSNLE